MTEDELARARKITFTLNEGILAGTPVTVGQVLDVLRANRDYAPEQKEDSPAREVPSDVQEKES